jgi:LacI family transcriptional regulator
MKQNEEATGRMREKAPTIIDVAAVAGVSKSTVSNALRNRPGVADTTRRRVQEAVDRLGYRTNIVARQLVQQRTAIMGVIVGDLTNPFYAEMMKLLERYAARHGYTAMFCNTEGDEQSETAGVNTLLEYRVAGILFLASIAGSRAVEEALASRVPAIFVSCRDDRTDSVAVDDQNSVRVAVQHLIDLGHRRIGYLTTSRAEFGGAQKWWDGCWYHGANTVARRSRHEPYPHPRLPHR